MSTSPAEEQRLARKARRRESRRRDILEAARAVLRREGLDGFTMSAVAERADLSKAAVFYYFRSKDDVMAALASALLDEEADALVRAIEQAPTALDALAALARAHFEQRRDDLPSFRALSAWLQSAGARPELLASSFYPGSQRVNDALEARLERDRAAGAVHPDVHPRLLANVAYLFAHGLLALTASLDALGGGTRFAPDELLDEACATLRRGAAAG